MHTRVFQYVKFVLLYTNIYYYDIRILEHFYSFKYQNDDDSTFIKSNVVTNTLAKCEHVSSLGCDSIKVLPIFENFKTEFATLLDFQRMGLISIVPRPDFLLAARVIAENRIRVSRNEMRSEMFLRDLFSLKSCT
jgi:hypothetical protein